MNFGIAIICCLFYVWCLLSVQAVHHSTSAQLKYSFFHLRRMWFGTERVVSLSPRSIHKVSISSPSTLLLREKKNYLSFQQKALTPSVSLWHSPQLSPSASLWLWEDKHQAFQHSLAASNEYFQREKTAEMLCLTLWVRFRGALYTPCYYLTAQRR